MQEEGICFPQHSHASCSWGVLSHRLYHDSALASTSLSEVKPFCCPWCPRAVSFTGEVFTLRKRRLPVSKPVRDTPASGSHTCSCMPCSLSSVLPFARWGILLDFISPHVQSCSLSFVFAVLYAAVLPPFWAGGTKPARVVQGMDVLQTNAASQGHTAASWYRLYSLSNYSWNSVCFCAAPITNPCENCVFIKLSAVTSRYFLIRKNSFRTHHFLCGVSYFFPNAGPWINPLECCLQFSLPVTLYNN